MVGSWTAMGLIRSYMIFLPCFTIAFRGSQALNACDLNQAGGLVNETLCLSGIQNASSDITRFWFGTWYSVNCPPGPLRYTLDCRSFNPDSTPRSIASQILTEGTYDLTKIISYVDLVYTSGPGKYQGCGNTYNFDETKTFRVNPLSMESHVTWTLRQTPQVTWSAQNDTEYTLVVVDVGYFFIHGLYINIAGNDISKGKIIKPYHGPRNMKSMPNPYAFLLFEQTQKNMTVLPHHLSALFSYGMTRFNVSNFAADHKLEGPIGMNWVSAAADPYAIGMQSKRGIENCAYLVGKALKNHSRPFLPAGYTLSVFVDVTFSSPAISFTMCCQDYSFSKTDINLNPLGNGKISAVHSRSATLRQVKLRRTGTFLNTSVAFTGKHLTLLMVDPDVPDALLGNSDLPLVHWMILNIKNGDIQQGDEILTYRGPLPPDRKPHTYYFLLYEQTTGVLPVNDTARHSGANCSADHAGRCLFNVTSFTADNSLTLIGATWMVSENSPFVSYSYMHRGHLASKLCAGVSGYADPCPVGSAVPVYSWHQNIFMGILISLILYFVPLVFA